MQRLLFPHLEDSWAYLDLNTHAKEVDTSLADPAVQQEWVDKLHARFGVLYSYGGYMEHRTTLLKEAYNAGVGEDHFWHLGIDYNVPKRTPVCMPVDGFLRHSEMDPDTNGGWGGKLIFQVGDIYLILGHLDGIVTEERIYKRGEMVGWVADYPINGNWFPHLHIQCCAEFDPKVDGYSHYYEGIERDFPNPSVLLRG